MLYIWFNIYKYKSTITWSKSLIRYVGENIHLTIDNKID